MVNFLKSRGVSSEALDPSVLLSGTLDFDKAADFFAHPARLVRWNSFAAVLNRLEPYFPDENATIEFVRWSMSTDALWVGVFRRLVSLVTGPARLYGMMEWAGKLNFSNLSSEQRSHPGGTLTTRAWLRPEDDPCRLFFRICHAAHVLLPTMINLPEAAVSSDIKDRSIVIQVVLPPGLGFLSRVRRFGKALLFANQAVRELAERDERLRVQYIELQAAKTALAQKVTERTRELERSQADMSLLMASVPDLICKISRDKKITYINRVTENFTLDRVLGMNALDFVPAGDRDRYSRTVDEVIATGSARITEIRVNDNTHWQVRLVPLLVNGQVDSILTINTEVTAQRQAEARLIEARDLAESASRAKSAFLANISHEIRTPLTAIEGFAELLLDRRDLDPKVADAVERIHRNSTHLHELVSGILDLAKIETGTVTLTLGEFEPYRLLMEIAEMFQAVADRKGVRLEVTPSGRGADTVVTGDVTRIRQILLNLVGNALKFTDQGAIRLAAEVVGQAPGGPGDRLEIMVEDTGSGIPPAFVPQLFRPFEQADSGFTRRHGGTGLGLFLSRQIARLMGGDLELVQSVEGQGATFKVILPVGRQQRAVERVSAGAAVPAAAPAAAGAMILLVEDNPDIADLIRISLAMEGYEVRHVGDGREAVTSIDREAPDLVLMDLQLPTLDGMSATKVIRAGGFKGPILALSANANRDDRETCLENGFDGYLVKPVARDQLIHAVRERLGQPRH